MAISFACPKCGKQIRAKEEHAGRKGRCKGCGELFVIPAEAVAVGLIEFDDPPAAPARMPQRDWDNTPSPAPRTQAVMMISQKNVGIAILLSILFGPLGMLYSTIIGAVIMVVVSVLLALLTFGVSIIITWPVCVIWAAVAAHVYNRKLLRGVA